MITVIAMMATIDKIKVITLSIVFKNPPPPPPVKPPVINW
jgi:hypothetical protein